MIVPMTTAGRHQRRYDHRLRDIVQRTGDLTIATNLDVPRSTARGWLREAPKVVVSLDVTNLKTSELQQEVLELRRRVKKLRALLRLAIAPSFEPPDSRLRTSVCPTDAPKSGSCERSTVPVRLCQCGRSCGSSDCPRVGSMPGDSSSTRVRLMISRLARTRHPIDLRQPRSGRSRTW